MSITFQCTGCGRTLKVADELAGRKAKCPQCQTVLYIPAGPAAAVTPVRRSAPAAPPPAYDDAGASPAYEPEPGPRRHKKAKKSALPMLIILGSVLLLLVGGVTVAAIFVVPMFFGGGAGGDDYFFLPDNTQMVVSVRLNQLMTSGAVQQAKTQIPVFNMGLSSMTSQMGSLSLNDIDQVFIGGQNIPSGSADPNFVAVFHMNKATKPADVESMFKSNSPPISFTENKVGAYSVHEGKYASGNSPPGPLPAYVMLDDKRFLLSTVQTMHKVLERNKKPDLSDKLQAAIKQTDFNATIAFAANAKNAFPSMAAPPSGKAGQPAMANPFAPPPISFDKVDGVSVSVKVGTDVDVTATAICQDAASAGTLRDDLTKEVAWAQTMLALAALGGKGVPTDVSSQLNISPQVSGSNVTVQKTITVAPIIAFARDTMAQMQGGVPGNPGGFPGNPGVPVNPGGPIRVPGGKS